MSNKFALHVALYPATGVMLNGNPLQGWKEHVENGERYGSAENKKGSAAVSLSQIIGSRLRGGYFQVAPWGLEISGGDQRHIFSGHKHYPDLPAGDRGLVLGHNGLKDLGALMGRAVILGGAEQARIILLSSPGTINSRRYPLGPVGLNMLR
jgi:hypothetical protein